MADQITVHATVPRFFWRTRTSRRRAALAVLAGLSLVACSGVAALAQRSGPPPRPPGGGGERPTPPPPQIFRAPPPPPPPTPVFVPAESTESTVTPLVPTDVTSAELGEMPLAEAGSEAARAGLFALKPNEMPPRGRADGKGEGIYVLSQEHSDYGRPRSTVVDLKSGTIFVSVRKPTNLGYVDSPLGVIALAPDSAIIVGYNDGVLRVMNLTGTGKRVKISLDRGPFAGDKHFDLGVTPGYEVVAGTSKLGHAQLRPADKIARRHSSFLGRDNLAVSEFSLESALQMSELIASLKQKDTAAKEQRVLGDMSKMAAVINQMRGAIGFVAEGDQKLP